MPSLRKPRPFRRPGRGDGLPGQSTADDLALDSQIRIVEKPAATIVNEELVQVGNIGAGDYIQIEAQGMKFFADSNLTIHINSDGDLFIGSDLSTPAGTYLCVFANAQTYNSESMAAGDMLIGDNSASKANILWDKSAGQLIFRGGTSSKAYIDTDGAITAGEGDVVLDDTGLHLVSGIATTNQFNILDETDTITKIYAEVDSNTSSGYLIIQGKDSTDREAFLQIRAITDDGAAHAGAADSRIELNTAADRITLASTTIGGFKVSQYTALTTTQRNALSAVNGMIIYNTTTSKFQGYAGGAWVDLH